MFMCKEEKGHLKQSFKKILLQNTFCGTYSLSLIWVRGLTLGMETLAWRPLIFTLSGLTDRSVWP